MSTESGKKGSLLPSFPQKKQKEVAIPSHEPFKEVQEYMTKPSVSPTRTFFEKISHAPGPVRTFHFGRT